jgi:hypothetical protein
MTTSDPGLTGFFHYARATGAWTWSDQLYSIFGFEPGDVVPTLDLILVHQHLEDRADVEAHLDEAIATGRPFSLWHRIRDAHGNTRQVVMVGAGDFDGDGELHGFSGYLIDLTEALRRTTSREVDEAMEQMSQSRPTIEQAKGVLMVRFRLSDDEAFALLRSYSQHANVKVRDLARSVVEAATSGRFGEDDAELWASLAVELAGEGEATG